MPNSEMVVNFSSFHLAVGGTLVKVRVNGEILCDGVCVPEDVSERSLWPLGPEACW